MLSNSQIRALIKQALQEDRGGGDITTESVIAPELKAEGAIVSRQEGLLCGISIAREVFLQIDRRLIFHSIKEDGSWFGKNEKIATVKGKAQAILTAERVALNFLALSSGIATTTRAFVNKSCHTKVKIMDTRKTVPTLRHLEKYAVRVGGGHNHRTCLDEAVLIKDNHLLAGGFLRRGKLDEAKFKALMQHLRQQHHKIEVEVGNLEEYKGVIKYKPDIVMLDNFSLSQLKRAVAFRDERYPRIKLEASGGVNLRNVQHLAETGVEFISIGALTHSPRAIDFSLEIISSRSHTIVKR